jgi:hypothetical protein
VGKAVHSSSIGGIGLAALALLLGATPAAAEEARTTLSVTATVVPACSIRQRSGAQHLVACSNGARIATMTARHHDEQPLEDAAAILGTPVRRRGSVIFTRPVRIQSPHSAERKSADSQPRYLTITY